MYFTHCFILRSCRSNWALQGTNKYLLSKWMDNKHVDINITLPDSNYKLKRKSFFISVLLKTETSVIHKNCHLLSGSRKLTKSFIRHTWPHVQGSSLPHSCYFSSLITCLICDDPVMLDCTACYSSQALCGFIALWHCSVFFYCLTEPHCMANHLSFFLIQLGCHLPQEAF